MKPTTVELQELKELIAGRLDVFELLNILNISMYELVDILEPVIIDYFEELLDAVDG
jgi:hypothetical protein